MDLITGASGFIGQRLYRSQIASQRSVGVTSRTVCGLQGAGVLDLQSESPPALELFQGVDCVFHCAGYAHAFSSLGEEDARTHWRINFEGTRKLVEAAGSAGIRKFIFLSSVKAMAEPGSRCIEEDHPGTPCTAYGQSKRAAEDAVLEAGARFGMHVVNLRLAMVYGAGGHGNLERMGHLVRRGLFPPLPETGNRRSLVHVDDVIEAMRLVADDPRASGRTYIIASPESPSGRQLFDALRSACGLPPIGWQVPLWSLQLAATAGDVLGRMTGKRVPLNNEALDRLVGSACYSSARIERELGWRARTRLADGLKEMLGS